MPYPPCSPDLTLSDFFVSLGEKSSQRETFYRCGEMKQKKTEALKGIKIDEFKSCSEQWNNISIGALHQMESTLKVIEI